jgi:dihydroorotate dehydrogenase electron transfer subunit
VKLHRREVLSRERFGDHVLLRYRWTGAPPEPGQFIMARPAGSSHSLDPFLARPFFAHDHDGEAMSLLVEVRGRATSLLAGCDEVAVSGPLGRGFTVSENGPVALVGGGVWVSPLKLLSRRLTRSGIPHRVCLELPVTAPAAYEDWISRSFPGADMVPTSGSSGAPEALLDRLGDLSAYARVCVSGPSSVLSAAREACAGKVSAELALREMMACVTGACHGCAVPVWAGGERGYARACLDGPVFPAEALAW